MLTKEDGEIDWKLTAVEIWRVFAHINPGPDVLHDAGKAIENNEAVPLPGGITEPGKVVSLRKLSGVWRCEPEAVFWE